MKVIDENSVEKVRYRDLFYAFSSVGMVTFGGGLVMIPLIQKNVVDKFHWMEDEDFLETVAICNSAPGAFTINLAIFLGYQKRGLLGALVASMGMVLPAFCIVLALAYAVTLGKDIEWLEKFFAGVRPVVIALLLDAGFKLGKNTIKSKFDIGLLALGTFLLVVASVTPIVIILAGALISIFYYREKVNKDNKDNDNSNGENKNPQVENPKEVM